MPHARVHERERGGADAQLKSPPYDRVRKLTSYPLWCCKSASKAAPSAMLRNTAIQTRRTAAFLQVKWVGAGTGNGTPDLLITR
jgi:hypothetical protein